MDQDRLPAELKAPGSVSFAEFTDRLVDVRGVRLRVRYAGAGPAVLLIHGHPRTGATWSRVAPLLVAAGYAVVCPDMRGYGASTSPPPLPDHVQQSKREVAADLVDLMAHLGHRRFCVVGHDRGSYVALRLALDHPKLVARLVVLDGVPISEALDRANANFARSWWHWFFLAQPKIPERVINADPDAWYHLDPEQLGEPGFSEMQAAIHDRATVLAMIEDYRAGLDVDAGDERADREAGRTVTAPTLFLWSSRDDMEELYGDPLAVWRPWAPDLRGHSIESGHHLAEENPQALVTALANFFAGRSAR